MLCQGNKTPEIRPGRGVRRTLIEFSLARYTQFAFCRFNCILLAMARNFYLVYTLYKHICSGYLEDRSTSGIWVILVIRGFSTNSLLHCRSQLDLFVWNDYLVQKISSELIQWLLISLLLIFLFYIIWNLGIQILFMIRSFMDMIKYQWMNCKKINVIS